MTTPRALADLERDRFFSQAEHLAQLIQHPSWPAYQDLLASMRLSALEEMARCTSEDFRYWQGVVGVLAEIMSRPQQIAETAAVVAREEMEADPSRIREAIRAVMNSNLEGDL